MNSVCPFCKEPTGGTQHYLICSKCYLSPLHLIAKEESITEV